MTRHPFGRLTRDSEAPLLFESFFVAAVASFLGIRAFLALTGYPQVGSNGLHVAHMLWGGLLMLAALSLHLAFLDRSVSHASAVIGGLGFGTFIDEIGKFVTADNDYFFRPAIALIYAAFVILFLVARVLVGRRRLSPDEALANAVAQMAGAPAKGLEPDDRARIQDLLDLADPAETRTKLATKYLAAIPAMADHDSLFEIVSDRLAAVFGRVMALPGIDPLLTAAVIVYTAIAVIGVGAIVFASSGAGQGISLEAGIQMVSTIAGAALVGRGVIDLPTSRPDAYHWFMRGLLVWILITQVFVFYSSQLGGLAGLAIDLLAYGSLRYAIDWERAAARATTIRHPGAGSSK